MSEPRLAPLPRTEWTDDTRAALRKGIGEVAADRYLADDSTPVPNVLVGGELQWGRREHNSDGFSSDGFKIQFSFKYNFSARIGG